MAGLGTTEILIILAVVLLLFGSAKLPTLARSLGKSARILKAETKGLHDNDDDERPQQAQAAPQQPVQPVQQPVQYPQQQYAPPQQGQLPPGQPIQGVPVDPSQARDNR
jgi:sec-independent protein translocase protein TatA